MTYPHESPECDEAIAERAAIIEHDGLRPKPVAEALARSALRVYHVAATHSGKVRHMTVIAPGVEWDEMLREQRKQWGSQFISCEAMDRDGIKAAIERGLTRESR